MFRSVKLENSEIKPVAHIDGAFLAVPVVLLHKMTHLGVV